MINFDDITAVNIKEHKPDWSQIPGHLYGIFIIGGSGSGKTNALLNLISHQQDIDKTYWNTKDPYKGKYQFLIKKQEGIGLQHYDSKAFIEYLNNMDHIHEHIEEC